MSTRLLENIQSQPHALRTTLAYQMTHREKLVAAAELLKGGKRVIVSGMGASFIACLPFSYRTGARAIESSELLYFLNAEIDGETVLVLTSRSGESVEVARLLPLARQRGAKVIGITNVAGSSLDRGADVSIILGCPADEMVAIQTYTATVAVLALLDAARTGDLDPAAADAEQTAAILEKWIPECIASRLTWDRFLAGDRPLYLLGRGMASGSVAEGVLLMHETAKASMVGMSVAQFRHGPVEAVDERFRAVIIGTQAATSELDAALVKDLAGMGGEARWIGPENSASLCSWPSNVPERFIPIAEIIPLQLLAYRKAELSGIRPGEFRWAPLVTATETGFSPGFSH